MAKPIQLQGKVLTRSLGMSLHELLLGGVSNLTLRKAWPSNVICDSILQTSYEGAHEAYH